MKHEPESLWFYYGYDFLPFPFNFNFFINSFSVGRDSIGQKSKNNVETEGFSFTGKVKDEDPRGCGWVCVL